MKNNTSLNFDFSIKLYEETRVFDKNAFEDSIIYLTKHFPPSQYPKLFEPGIGTGRIAIPLAKKGYEITGVDISNGMLNYLNYKLDHGSNKKLKISSQNQDITNLQFPNDSFDIGIAVHLFYFIPNWQKAVQEILRVLKNDAPLILMHTGMGMEVPELNEQYKILCKNEGYTVPNIGVKSTNEVIAYLKELNCSIEKVNKKWRWIANINATQAIYYLKERAYSFTSKVPEMIHNNVIKHLENDYGNSNCNYNIQNEIYFVIVKNSAKVF